MSHLHLDVTKDDRKLSLKKCFFHLGEEHPNSEFQETLSCLQIYMAYQTHLQLGIQLGDEGNWLKLLSFSQL